VSLDNGQIRLYDDRNCLSILNCPEPSLDLAFGEFLGENGALFTVSRSRKLKLSILKRNALLDFYKEGRCKKEFGSMKRTKAFIDCTRRERQFATGK
jgi:hypothetical protein